MRINRIAFLELMQLYVTTFILVFVISTNGGGGPLHRGLGTGTFQRLWTVRIRYFLSRATDTNP